ncbi:MAG: MFS transporter [Puniceicoccales bacterium]
MSFFAQQDSVSEEELHDGKRNLIYAAVCTQVLGVLGGGAFLVAFALELNASNLLIGFLAAFGPASQIMQIPSIYVVEKLRNRKALVVLPTLIGRFSWLFIPFIPYLLPPEYWSGALFSLIVFYFGISAVAGCAFNSWMRDLIPQKEFGNFFGKRLSIASLAGAVATLAAGWSVTPLLEWSGDPFLPFSLFFLIGGLIGIGGTQFTNKVPEPRPEPAELAPFLSLLFEPIRSKGFRQLLIFTVFWSFAANMAGAFFGVYMLRRLEMPMGIVISLSVLSQVVNVLFYRIWGSLADSWSNRSVLLIAGQLFMIATLIWPFTTFPEPYFLTIPLLILIHVMTGISTAGVILSTANLAMKNAPRGKATAFLASNALFNGSAATLAPIVGGIIADSLASREFSANFSFTEILSDGEPMVFSALYLRGLDFVFILAAIVGFYGLHRLAYVEEPESRTERLHIDTVLSETRKSLASVSNVAGLRKLAYFPFYVLATRIPLPRSPSRRKKGAKRPNDQNDDSSAEEERI